MELPIYEIFHDKLNQPLRKNGNTLEVLCPKCKQWFVPNLVDIITSSELIKLGIPIKYKIHCGKGGDNGHNKKDRLPS